MMDLETTHISDEIRSYGVYQPAYDTTIRKTTVVEYHETLHTNQIDWENYPFYSETSLSDKQVDKLIETIRKCEKYQEHEIFVSNYGGWPRIWSKVIGVGMASIWPRWTPRPTIIVESNIGSGAAYYDWTSITDIKYNV